MIFYGDNPPRADHLQALINHVAIIQTDVAREKKRMDALETRSRDILNQLLKRGEIKTLDELNEQAMSRLTPEERKEYKALIEATKLVGKVTNILLYVGLALAGEKILTVGGPVIMSIARGAAAMNGVQGILGSIVGAAEGVATGVAAAGEGLAQAAQKATQAVAESGAAGAAATGTTGTAVAGATETAVTETKKVTRSIAFLSKYGKWLNALGLVLLAVVPLVEVVQGSLQKEKLVEGIHNTQVARLAIASLREEARQVTNTMSTIKNYLELRNTGGTIEKVGDDLVQSIRSAHAEIDLTRLEKELRAETNKEGSYTKDDLEVADVVLLVIKEQEDEKHVAPKAEANGGPK